MSSGSFVIALTELEHGPKSLNTSLPLAWLSQALAEAQALPDGDGSLSVKLQKHGEEVMVRGHASARVSVPCVVTLDPVPLLLEPEIFLLLRRAVDPRAEPSRAKKRAKSGAGGRNELGSAGKRRRKAAPLEEDAELSNEEAGRDTFQGDEITLDGFVREFLLLEIPPYPRRADLPSPEESIVSRPLAGPTEGEQLIDPRLEPLAKLAARLRGEEHKE